MSSTQSKGAGAQSSPTSQQWESLKPMMYQLYMEQELPLAQVREEMARQGHNASSRMYKDRFKQWGFRKYTSKEDWQAFAMLRHHASAAGTNLHQVLIHKRIRSLPELEHYLRRHETSEADFLKKWLESGASVPQHVQPVPDSVSQAELVMPPMHIEQSLKHSCESCAENSSSLLHPAQGSVLLQPVSPLRNLRRTPCDSNDSHEDPEVQQYRPDRLPQSDELHAHLYMNHEQAQSPSSKTSRLSMYLAQAANPPTGIMPASPPYSDLTAIAKEVEAPPGARTLLLLDLSRNLGIHNSFNDHFDFRAEPGIQICHEPGNLNGAGSPRQSGELSSGGYPSFPSYSSLVQPDLPMVSNEDSDPMSEEPSSENISPGFGPMDYQLTDHTSHQSQYDYNTTSWKRFLPSANQLTIDKLGEYQLTAEHYAFMIDCFMAFMSGAAGNVDTQGSWLEQASLRLRAMCAAQDPMFLVAIHSVLVWLQVHDTDSRAESFIRALSRVTACQLGEDSLFAIMLKCMTAAAGKIPPNSLVGLDALRRLVHDLKRQHGLEHPHTIIARYYMCFHMLLVGYSADAEEELKVLHCTISKVLGPSTFLAVCVLGTLSRAQSRQNKYHMALDTIVRCIEEYSLGWNHPHRLHLMVRKALICWRLKLKLKEEETTERMYWDNEMENLYWTVVRGRVATLGRYHKHTEAAHDSLVEILQDNGKWNDDDVKEKVQELLKNPGFAVETYECWWRSMVPRDRDGHGQGSSSEEME